MSERPACIHVSTSDVGGGAEQVARCLHGAMQRLGWDSTLAVGWKHDEVEGCVQIPNARYGTVRSRMIRKWRVALGCEIAPYPATMHIPELGKSEPSILHLHNLHGHYFDLRALPYLSNKYPTVLTAHDGWLLSGHCAHGVDCDRWLTGCHTCPHLDYPPAIAHDRTFQNWREKHRLVQESNLHVVAPSQWMAQRFQQAFGDHLGSIQVIGHGVDRHIFHPRDKRETRQRYRIPEDAYVIGVNYLGTDNPYKDPWTIRKLIEKQMDRHRDTPVIILCLGDAQIPSLPSSATVMRTGHLSQDEVGWALNCCDLLVHAAHAESFGLISAEAQLCGVPVLLNEGGGLSETLSDNPEKDFDLEVMARRYLDLYERIRNKK